MRKNVYVIGMIVMVLIVIAEGFVIYNLYAFIKKEENMYAHHEKEYIKQLSDQLKLERKGLRHDTRGGDFCPACESKDVAEIRYGYYDSKMDVWKEELECGKVILGGCIVCENSKRFYCNKCGYKWGCVKAVGSTAITFD